MAEDASQLRHSPHLYKMRSVSPSPSITPSLALGACPDLDRSVSDASIVSSSYSSRSVSSTSDAPSSSVRRRGYARPQGTTFSASARNRDSVMSLGSIAHMQYYFARTGLLDGKGGQIAHTKVRPGEEATEQAQEEDTCIIASDDQVPASLDTGMPPAMLPPTVSTYRTKIITTQPPPDSSKLRADLTESLDAAAEALARIHPNEGQSPGHGRQHDTNGQGGCQVECLHILDLMTLAIQHAKDYCTFHANPLSIYELRSERLIRSDLYNVLETLKRAASRDFAAGFRRAERETMVDWVRSIQELLALERHAEEEKDKLRLQWPWLQGDWTDRERERERLFLMSLDGVSTSLPEWKAPSAESPGDFLKSLSTGLRLVQLHNDLTRQSTRRFGEIKSFYNDVDKPYRCAENLRYWSKAAELRWDVRLKLDVLAIVYDRDAGAWKDFDQAVLKWSATVREELTRDWLGIASGDEEAARSLRVSPP